MPSLTEILKDPNYVNANEATKRAIFNKYSAQDQNFAGANDATKNAIRQRFGIIEVPVEQAAPNKEPETGFIAGIKSGYERLKGDVGAIGATAGVEGAEEYAAKQRKKAGEIYKQPEFTERPIDYVTGLLGQSLPYMVAPIAAAAVAPAGLLAMGAAGAASAAQFTGSNISRQLEEGVSAKDAKVVNAMAASVPQAALDVIGFKFMPAISKLFSKAGTPLTEQAATSILGKYILPAAKTAGVEGATEAGQQVLERAQAGLSITDEEARKEYFDSFVGGAILGGAISIPGGAIERARAKPPVETLPPEEKPAAERPAEAAVAPQAPAAITPEAKQQEQIRMEDELRARAEAPPITEAEFVERPPAPKLDKEEEQRLAAMGEDKETLEKEAKKLKKPERGSSLWSAMKGNLTPSDYAELGDKSFAGLKAPRGMGKSISELAADGSLNLWLPPNLQMTRGQQNDFIETEGDELTKAKAADEYIKERLRERNYLTWATNNRLEEIGTSLSDIESSFREIADVELANQLFQEAYNEQKAIDQEVEGVATEGEVGGIEPPANVLEAIPEETVEEEYFPDQDVLKEENIKGKLAEQADNKIPNLREDIPNENWLQGKIDYAISKGRNQYGVPHMSTVTGSYDKPVEVSTNVLTKLKGERGEQDNVREESLDYIRKNWDEVSKQPPYIEVAYNGEAWVSEGNHRIMVAAEKGIKSLPVEIKYFDGGQLRNGPLSPSRIPSLDKGVTGQATEQAKFVINKDPEHQRIEKELTGKSMQQVAQWAVDNAPNQFAKAIAQKVMSRINGMAKRGIKMEFEIETGNSRWDKMFDARGRVDYSFGAKGAGKQPTFKMTLNGAAVIDNQRGYPPGTRYITVLHELLHVSTVGQINVLKSDDPLVKDLKDLFNKVVSHFNTEVKAKRITPFMQRIYSEEINALTSPDELLAWGISDQGMQEFLSEIKVGEQTMMDKLVELIRKILNVTKPYLTALDQLVKTTESILDEDVNVVGDKIIAKQYSFGVKPGEGEAVQGTLFQQEEKQTPVQRAKATAQKALQKRTLPKSQFEGVADDLYAELQPVFAPENKTIINKIEGMQNDFWKKLAQGIADQYRSIKDISEDAYMKARMSKTVDGALEGILFNGEVKLTDDALDIAKDTKGLFKALEPVGKEVDRYQIWVALNRDAQLVAQGKAPSVKEDIVRRRNELAEGKIGNKSRLEVYRQVQQDMNKLNRSVLKIAFKQGIIDKEAYKVYARDINYIPFYKMMDENSDVQSVATKSGLVNQYFSKELKGGQKYFGDLMENTLRNWSHILSASMKNEAANATIRAALELEAAFPNLKVGLDWRDGKVYSEKSGQLVGDGKLKPEYTTSGKGTIKTMINGIPAYFDVKEPLLLESIMSIAYMGPKSKFLDVARNFKNWLQFGVTLSPAFKIRNLFRDSISAMAVTDLKKNPFANVINNWASTDKNNPAHISALAGGAIFNFGSVYEGDQAKLIKRLLDSGVRGDTILDNEKKIKAGLLKAWNKYQEYGNKSEAANRMALYNQLKEQGLSHLEASFQARDMLDFSMQGAWPAFRFLTQVVPFLNARVQGLYKLGRDGIIPTSRVIYNTVTGKPDESTKSDKKRAEQFGIVMTAVALASLMLYMAFKDDEEFKKREQWDRDNFWWFKLPGMEAAFRVPKPFEIGALGTVAERVAEQIMDEGVEGKVFGQSLSRMMTDTFAINPTPQMFKPLIDLYSNKDSFTGAPIETAGMERLSKAERIADRTSPLAIGLSKVSNVFLPESMEVSPVQTDYTIKSYFGWLGGTVSWLSHYAVMPFSKSAYPDNNWTETMSMGFIKSLPATQSKYVTAFYENNKEISQAYADMRHFAQLGQADKVQEILKEKGDKIAMAKFYDNASKDMSKMRQAIQAIRNDENMSGAQKKEEIDRMKIIIGEIAKQMEDARIMVKKQYATSE